MSVGKSNSFSLFPGERACIRFSMIFFLMYNYMNNTIFLKVLELGELKLFDSIYLKIHPQAGSL